MGAGCRSREHPRVLWPIGVAAAGLQEPRLLITRSAQLPSQQHYLNSAKRSSFSAPALQHGMSLHRGWRQIPGELALPRSCRGTEGHNVPVLRSHQVPKPGWGLLGDTSSRDLCPGSCSPCGTVPGGCVGARATGHVARPCLPASSLAILKPYSSPVPLIRNANDVMKLDSSIACSS